MKRPTDPRRRPDPRARIAGRSRWRREAYRIIFEHDTPAGRAFDVGLIAAILVSVVIVMLDSVAGIRARHGSLLRLAEWVFTLLFTVEYVLRLATAPSATGYARSFFGVVDLLAVLPTWLSLVVPGGQYFIVLRVLRLVRVFRVLKLVRFLVSERILIRAMRASLYKIVVFLVAVLTIVVIVGAAMHLVEGPDAGFTSIPRGVYWAIVTLTTVGYGDIAPQSPLGQILAALVMVMGYGIIAVPTGIVTVEMASAARGVGGTADLSASSEATLASACAGCGATGHAPDARYCRRCGVALASASGSNGGFAADS